MKKFIASLIMLVVLFSVAFAEFDLSSMTYSDLMKLREQVQRELLSRPEWKEVTVPAGEWTVGEDIPAGFYSIKSVNDIFTNVFVWGREQYDYDAGGGLLLNSFVGDGSEIGKVRLKNGNILVVRDPVILAPAQSLGF